MVIFSSFCFKSNSVGSSLTLSGPQSLILLIEIDTIVNWFRPVFDDLLLGTLFRLADPVPLDFEDLRASFSPLSLVF